MNDTDNSDSERRDCLMGHEWCDGPDGDAVEGEPFGGLCGDCYIQQGKEKYGNEDTDS